MNAKLPENDSPAKWPARILQLAAVYNLVWGTWVILFPHHLFDWANIPRPNYPGIWQCVGMIVGVYGVGYWIASRDFVRHWPIVLVGLIGKTLGPIGFFLNATSGELPWSWGLTIIPNDLIWWIPFGAILYLVFKIESDPKYGKSKSGGPLELSVQPSFEEVNKAVKASNGESLWDITHRQKTLLVFVRHAGCTFCRETLHELKNELPRLQSQSIVPVVVHMSTEADGRKMLVREGLDATLQISNPDSSLYRAYELKRGQILQLFGPVVWWRGFKAAILKGHGFGALEGDGFQLGGAFLIENGRILKSFPAKNAADPVPFECLLNQNNS